MQALRRLFFKPPTSPQTLAMATGFVKDTIKANKVGSAAQTGGRGRAAAAAVAAVSCGAAACRCACGRGLLQPR
jgi:hypothetical protein